MMFALSAKRLVQMSLAIKEAEMWWWMCRYRREVVGDVGAKPWKPRATPKDRKPTMNDCQVAP